MRPICIWSFKCRSELYKKRHSNQCWVPLRTARNGQSFLKAIFTMPFSTSLENYIQKQKLLLPSTINTNHMTTWPNTHHTVKVIGEIREKNEEIPSSTANITSAEFHCNKYCNRKKNVINFQRFFPVGNRNLLIINLHW